MGRNDFVQTPQQRAWSEACEQYEQEVAERFHRRVSDMAEGWRLCSVRQCRRRRRCSDKSLICHAILDRERPVQELTPTEEARFKYQFHKAIQASLAKAAAEGRPLGEERARRIEELRRQKLASYGIVEDRKHKGGTT